jgi:hypothetical protein
MGRKVRRTVNREGAKGAKKSILLRGLRAFAVNRHFEVVMKKPPSPLGPADIYL